MRILLVSHPPLAREFGAAQVALELAAALRARGHEAIAWSPEPLPPATRWWNVHLAQRRAIERYLEAEPRFDVVDLPALSISRAVATLARGSRLVARSNQPAFLYLAAELRAELRRRPLPPPRLPLHAAQSARIALALAAGFRRADLVLCLGSLEERWMARRFPGLAPRLAHYLHALPEAERPALAAVRRARRPPAVDAGIRFLWLGRFVAHKGPERLLAWARARAASHPRDTLTIAGCGAEGARALASEPLAQGFLRTVPSYTRAELPALLAGHHVGLFTSVAEGWGLALQEMVESGLPVYATPAGGAADLAAVLPRTIRPFPPPERFEPADFSIDDLDANGYSDRFSWARIAADYERLVAERGAR